MLLSKKGMPGPDFDINISNKPNISAVCYYLTVTSSANIKIFSGQGPNEYMQNVVYREVLEV